MSTHALTGRGALRKSDVREANERYVLNIIRQSPLISRSDLARISGFSASSVTFIVNRMIKDGLLREVAGEGSALMGRPPVGLTLQSEAMVVIGVEITSTQARVISADANGKTLAKKTVAAHLDHKVYLGRAREAIRSLVSRYSSSRLLGVGVSLVGTIDRMTGKVIADENQGWFDIEAGRILSDGIQTSFYFENNAKLCALAERWFAEPRSKPLDHFVFVLARGGLGTGVIIEGRLLRGAFGEASEFGHTLLYPEGRRCVCGNTGCWEEYASQRAIERIYVERQRDSRKRTDAEAIVRLARGGDSVALEVLREVAGYLGMGFANLNWALNPEAIIVGDYIASAWDLIEDWVWESLKRRAASRYLTRLRIFPARHGADSALMGALALTLSHYFSASTTANGLSRN